VNGPKHSLVGTDAELQAAAFSQFAADSVARDQSFMAVIWFLTPHEPYETVPKFRQLYEGPGDNYTQGEMDYYGDVSAMDAGIGMIRFTLKELGVAHNTIVVFSGGDNGPEHLTPGSAVFGGQLLKGRKRDLGEGGIRQAGLIEWPAMIKQNRRTDYAVSIVDYVPTLLDLYDASLPHTPSWPLDGESLVGMLETQGAGVRKSPLAWVTGHYSSEQITHLPVNSCDDGTSCKQMRYDHGRITRSARPPSEQMAYVVGNLKLYANRTIANLTHPDDPAGNRTGHPYSCLPPTPSCPELKQLPWQWHLYNLSSDPTESTNLAQHLPEKLEEMVDALRTFATSVVQSQGPAENN